MLAIFFAANMDLYPGGRAVISLANREKSNDDFLRGCTGKLMGPKSG